MLELSFLQTILVWLVTMLVFVVVLLRSGYLIWLLAIAGAFLFFVGLRTSVDVMGVSSCVAAMLFALLGRVSGIGVGR